MILFMCLLVGLLLIALSFVVIPLVSARNFTDTSWYWVVGILLISLPCFAMVWYWRSGTPQQFFQVVTLQKQQREAQRVLAELGSTAAVITKLKQHLTIDPKSAQGWFLLGRLYLSNRELKNAVDAFGRAYHLQPKRPDIVFNYAEVLFFSRSYSQVIPLLKELLNIEPQNAAAINLLALAFYQKGLRQDAIELWQKLLTQFPLETNDREAIQKAIAKAKER